MYHFEHVEIPTSNLQVASKFYAALFNWKLDVFFGEGYLMITAPDGKTIGGLSKVDKPVYHEDFGVYVEVPEVAATLKKAASLGGGIVREKSELPEGQGFYGKIKTPDGYCIGIWSRA
jgi:predicted enzyme related to lactoylglutathione lyase